MKVCPLCDGKGIVPSAKIDPQNKKEYDVCPACKGLKQIEEIKTKKSTITIIKPHGVYSDMVSDIQTL